MAPLEGAQAEDFGDFWGTAGALHVLLVCKHEQNGLLEVRLLRARGWKERTHGGSGGANLWLREGRRETLAHDKTIRRFEVGGWAGEAGGSTRLFTAGKKRSYSRGREGGFSLRLVSVAGCGQATETERGYVFSARLPSIPAVGPCRMETRTFPNELDARATW